MTLLAEGLLALRGCWRLLRRDPAAYEDFNLTIDGFWRSFASALPILILAYPLFQLDYKFNVAWYLENGKDPPELQLGASYFYLLLGTVIWPLVAAILARLLGVGQNYVPYMIIYNWMGVLASALWGIPYLSSLVTGAMQSATILAWVVYPLLLYVSWYVAKTGLQTTTPVAFAFLLADLALSYGLGALSP